MSSKFHPLKPRPETLCTHGGRGSHPNSGFVNPPSVRGSTYLYPSVEALHQSHDRKFQPGAVGYGRYGTETTRELERLISELDGAWGAMTTSSGYAAITTALLAFLSCGDHLLMIDTAYAPTRFFCTRTLKRMGIETTFYSPDTGTEIATLIRDNTRLIFMESPGSLTFEVQDMQTLLDIAAQHGIVSMLDNTWASSVNYPAIARGFNVSIQAATKYIGGHSDLMMGVITTDEKHWLPVRKSYVEFAQSPGTEETMLALRGLRTLPCRLGQHAHSALQVAEWLEQREEVDAVYHPALPSHPDHALFELQFNAPSGLFAFSLHSTDSAAVAAFIEGLNYFSIGESWGGYESLVLPVDPRNIRTAKPWTDRGQLIRLSIGLEHPDDLIGDLSNALQLLSRHE